MWQPRQAMMNSNHCWVELFLALRGRWRNSESRSCCRAGLKEACRVPSLLPGGRPRSSSHFKTALLTLFSGFLLYFNELLLSQKCLGAGFSGFLCHMRCQTLLAGSSHVTAEEDLDLHLVCDVSESSSCQWRARQ